MARSVNRGISFDEVVIVAKEAREHFGTEKVLLQLQELAEATHTWLLTSPDQPRSPDCFSYDFDGSIKSGEPWSTRPEDLHPLADVPQPDAQSLLLRRREVAQAAAWEHGLLHLFDSARKRGSLLLSLVPPKLTRDDEWKWVVSVVTDPFSQLITKYLDRNARAAKQGFPDARGLEAISLGKAARLARYSPNVDAAARIRPKILGLVRLGLLTVKADDTGYAISVGPTAVAFIAVHDPVLTDWYARLEDN